MKENIETIINAVVLNEELSANIQLKVLDNLIPLAGPSGKQDIQDYLATQTKTKSQVTINLAQNALDWLNNK